MLGALKKNLKKLGNEASKAAEKAAEKASAAAEQASTAAEKAVKKASQEIAQQSAALSANLSASRSTGSALSRLMDATGLNKEANPHPNDFTDKILAFAQELEWKVAVEAEDCVVAVFQIDEQRSQGVYYFSQTLSSGEQVVEVHSPAVELNNVDDQQWAALSNQLLHENNHSANSGWAIESIGDKEYIVSVKELLLDTMDCDEFSYASVSVCTSADNLEQKFGGDQF